MNILSCIMNVTYNLELVYEKGIMDKTLVIVESPAKANTISRYLGNNYTVAASGRPHLEIYLHRLWALM